MNYYKIKSILHNGRKGKRYTNRTDGKYPNRINRIVEIDERDIVIGAPYFIQYVKDEHGNDYRNMVLTTSYVTDWDYLYEDTIYIETYNSIYEFEMVDEV